MSDTILTPERFEWLKAEVGRLRRLLYEGASVSQQDGRLTMTLPQAKAFAEHTAAAFTAMGGNNYVAIVLEDIDGQQWQWTLQKGGKPTPHDFRLEAEAECEVLRRERDALRDELEELRAMRLRDWRLIGELWGDAIRESVFVNDILKETP